MFQLPLLPRRRIHSKQVLAQSRGCSGKGKKKQTRGSGATPGQAETQSVARCLPTMPNSQLSAALHRDCLMRRNIFTLQPRPPPTHHHSLFPIKGPDFVFSGSSSMMKQFYKVNSATVRHLVITINRRSLDPFAMVSIQGGWKSFRVGGVLDSILRLDYFNCSAYISKGDVITAYWFYSRF